MRGSGFLPDGILPPASPPDPMRGHSCSDASGKSVVCRHQPDSGPADSAADPAAGQTYSRVERDGKKIHVRGNGISGKRIRPYGVFPACGRAGKNGGAVPGKMRKKSGQGNPGQIAGRRYKRDLRKRFRLCSRNCASDSAPVIPERAAQRR